MLEGWSDIQIMQNNAVNGSIGLNKRNEMKKQME